jgi:uncharacterized membrane-anchored protein
VCSDSVVCRSSRNTAPGTQYIDHGQELNFGWGAASMEGELSITLATCAHLDINTGLILFIPACPAIVLHRYLETAAYLQAPLHCSI